MTAFLTGSAFSSKRSATATVAAVSPPEGLAYSKTTRILSGTAEPGASITIRRDGIAAGTTTANGAGAWSFTFSEAPAAGSLLSASQSLVLASGNSPPIVAPSDDTTLTALSLSSSTFTAGAASGTVIGAIIGRTTGSTLSVVPADARVAISGANLVAGTTPAVAGSFNVTLRETLAGATNSPRDTVIALTVNSTLAAFPAFAPAFFRVAAGDPGNTVEQTDLTFAAADVDIANSKLALTGLNYVAFTSFSSAGATRVFFSSTGTLPAPLQADTPYYLSPASGGGFDLYPETTQAHWATTPTMLAEDAPMPAQNLAQRVNKIVLTSQGSGTHRIISNPLAKELPNLLSGGAAYKISTISTDRHQRFEIVSDGRGDKALLGRILVRDPASNGSYNLYGYGMDMGASELRLPFQTATRSKRSIIQFAVIEWRETDTFGITKVPIVPAGVNTSTGIITFNAHQMSTGLRVRLLAHANGGVLPAGFAGGATDYWVRSVSANTMTLHPTSADATANTNPVIPASQGTTGFLIYAPERPADSERMRFVAEWREPSTGGNTHTVCTNGSGFSGVTQTLPGDVISSGGNNGCIGAAGRTAQALVPTTGDAFRVRVRTPSGAVAPTRADTGLPLANAHYWMRKPPSTSAYVLLYDTEAACRADAGLSAGASSCIKFTASGSGFIRLERAGAGPLSCSNEFSRGSPVAPLTWQLPLGQKGLLTTITDYNDPTAANIRQRYYWNGSLVVDFQSDGAKGPTSAGTNLSDTGLTLMNSPGRHVPMEGLLYDLTLGASDGEITAADIGPVNTWLMAKYGIAP